MRCRLAEGLVHEACAGCFLDSPPFFLRPRAAAYRPATCTKKSQKKWLELLTLNDIPWWCRIGNAASLAQRTAFNTPRRATVVWETLDPDQGRPGRIPVAGVDVL